MGDHDLVVVASFLKHFEADIARSALQAAGIESIIRSDDCGGQRPHFWMGGIQLLVRAEDVDYASEVIEAQAAPLDEDAID